MRFKNIYIYTIFRPVWICHEFLSIGGSGLGFRYSKTLMSCQICIAQGSFAIMKHKRKNLYVTLKRSRCKVLAKRYSQLKPIRAKLQNQNLNRRVAKWYRQVEPARTKAIQLSKYIHNNNKTTWRDWVGWGVQTVEKMAQVGRKFEFDQIQADLTQLEPTQAKWVAKRYPTPSKWWTWLELAWVGRTVWPALGQRMCWPVASRHAYSSYCSSRTNVTETWPCSA